MHGGAPGSGAPRGNKNALKHGLYTREAVEERRRLRALVRQSRMLIQDLGAMCGDRTRRPDWLYRRCRVARDRR
jgi:hypothetical protein